MEATKRAEIMARLTELAARYSHTFEDLKKNAKELFRMVLEE